MEGTIEKQVDSKSNLLTAHEAARYMRMESKHSYVTVQRWARSGLLRGGKKGDQWVFRKEDLDDFLFKKK